MRLASPHNQVLQMVKSLEKEAWWMTTLEVEKELIRLEDMVDSLRFIDEIPEEDYDEKQFEIDFFHHFGLFVRGEDGRFTSDPIKKEENYDSVIQD